jgi:MoaA/NifB/PqqE/SkfB family radical SAM enzyme
MSFDQYRHVIDQFPRLKWCGMTGIGTGFLNKDYLRMLEYAKSRNIFVEFFDSFHLFNEERIRKVVGMGVDKIWVSIEAATKETYEKIRVGSKWEKVMENIRTLFRVKEEMKTPFPEVWFHFIITKDNVGEMEQFVDLVKGLVGDTRRNPIVMYWTSLLYFKEVEHLITEVPEDLKKRVMDKCRAYGMFPVFNENVTREKPVCQCTKWTEPFVLVSGHVQSCCAINEVNDRDFQEEQAFGNLFHERYSDIFRSRKFRTFKKLLQENKVPISCKNCRLYNFTEDQIVDKYWLDEGPSEKSSEKEAEKEEVPEKLEPAREKEPVESSSR